MPGDSGVTCMLVCALPLPLHQRPRSHRPPGIPCALNSERAGINEYLAKKAFGESAKSCSNVITREINPSSRRRPGPITTGFCCCAKAVEQRLSKPGPRRMGPGLRRDDDYFWGASAPHNPPPLPTASRGEGSRVAAACASLEPEAKADRGIDGVVIEVAVGEAAIDLRVHEAGVGIEFLRKLPIDGEGNGVERPVAGCRRCGDGAVDERAIGGLVIVIIG